MLFHRDGGVITLETVARFGLNLPSLPTPTPVLVAIPYSLLSVLEQRGKQIMNANIYLLTKYTCGFSGRWKRGKVQRNKDRESRRGMERRERKLERGVT